MTFLCVDASAWVKRYYREPGSKQVHRCFSRGDVLACSVLELVEVVATLARKCRAQEICRHDFDAKLAEIDRDWRHFVKIELTADSWGPARDAAASLALRGAKRRTATRSTCSRRRSRSGSRFPRRGGRLRASVPCPRRRRPAAAGWTSGDGSWSASRQWPGTRSRGR